MENKKFDFWQHHSLNYLKMALGHQRHEKIEDPDAHGKKTGECGDSIEFFLSIKEGCIQSVSFSTDGCLNTNACANTVSHLVDGKTINQAWEITPEDVTEYLETLPSHETHCSELAVGAFYLALSSYKSQ